MTTRQTLDVGRELGSLVASWRELDPERDAALAVDGVVPRYWCEPASPEELAAVLGFAGREKLAVIPRGGGSRMSLGMPPRAADLLVSTGGLSEIVEYEPADLTMTVQAGHNFGALQQRLAREGQFLALDPPSRDAATIGGIVASNASGPLRLKYGAARDLVIGMRVANSDGWLTKAGGRVVKNVAGYDLNKLYTGSLGTLGVLAELSFKLQPLPQARGTALAAFADARQADALVKRVMRSSLGPAALELLDGPAAAALGIGLQVEREGCVFAALSTGFDRAVCRVVEDVAAWAHEAGATTAETSVDQPLDRELWEGVAALPDASDPSHPVVKLAVPPSRTTEAYLELTRVASEAGLAIQAVVHAGVGLAFGRIVEQAWDEAALGRLAGLVERLRGWAGERRGSLVVEACPTELKRRLDVWGETGPALGLMRALKEKLDPAGVLNPGRYVGGI